MINGDNFGTMYKVNDYFRLGVTGATITVRISGEEVYSYTANMLAACTNIFL